MKDQAIEATVSSVAGKLAPVGAAVGVIGSLTSTDIAAYGGLLVAVVSAAISIFFKWEDRKRKRELHQWRLSGAKFPDDDSEG